MSDPPRLGNKLSTIVRRLPKGWPRRGAAGTSPQETPDESTERREGENPARGDAERGQWVAQGLKEKLAGQITPRKFLNTIGSFFVLVLLVLLLMWWVL